MERRVLFVVREREREIFDRCLLLKWERERAVECRLLC
jgi:hypothetical protein